MAKTKFDVGFPPRSSVAPKRRKMTRIIACEIRCERCLGKAARCAKCEREVQTFLKAVGGK